MSPDIKYLVWSVALTVVIMLIHVSGATLKVGLPKLAGNRENLGEPDGWVGRAHRTHINMLENLPLFGLLVLAAAVTQRANATTALGAEIFFWARVSHAAIYILGIPWIRTLAWAVSMVGLVLIFLQLV